jgi:RNA 2',3'-cyclic 3'-phosphodiesterase
MTGPEGRASSLGHSLAVESVRAFIAVETPESVKDEIGRLVSHFSHQGYPVRWVGRNNLHLTLVFLGSSPPEFIARVKERLARVAAATARFEMSVKGLGVFPNERLPRVIWLGIEQGKAELTALAQHTLKKLVAVGFIPEKRPFSAHLTIGRVREPLSDARAILERPFAVPAFPVSELVLFQSFLRPTGPVHEPLGRYPLASAMQLSDAGR